MMHAYAMGPAKDLTRIRGGGKHGSLRVEKGGQRLLFVGNDKKQISLTLYGPADVFDLAAALLSKLPLGTGLFSHFEDGGKLLRTVTWLRDKAEQNR